MRLGQYKGISAAKPVIQVPQQQIVKILAQHQKEYAVLYPVEGRAAKTGDQALLDFSGTLQGKPIRGAQRKNYTLVLGSHSFVPGFEEQIIGKKPGENFDIVVTFPKTYQLKQLQGKDVDFHIQLHKLYTPEYQTLDDDFAKDFSEYQTLEDWKQAIHQQLFATEENHAFEKLSTDILTSIINDSEISIDPSLQEDVAMEMYEDFVENLQAHHISLDAYCRQTGTKKADLLKHYEKDALRSIQEQHVLHAVAEKEHLRVSEEELTEELSAIAAEEEENPELFRTSLGDEEVEAIIDQIRMNKALEFVITNANLH